MQYFLQFIYLHQSYEFFFMFLLALAPNERKIDTNLTFQRNRKFIESRAHSFLTF